MRILRLAIAVGALGGILGRVPSGALALKAPRQATAVKCGKIYTVSDGVIDHGVILIEGGRIVEVRKGDAVPEGAKVIDASRQVVIPGLIDAYTRLTDGGEADETSAPEILASDGIDAFEEHWRLLSGGVTTVYVAPGTRRLITGQGAIAKTGGRDRILRASFGLQVILGEGAKNPPPIFKAPLPASAERPILPAKRQYPSSRMGEFAELRKIFSQAKEEGKGMSAGRRRPLLEALSGKRPALIEVHTADDMIKAVRFAEEIGLHPVLVNAEEAHKVVDYLAEHKVPVILNGMVSPRHRYLVDEARAGLEGEARFGAPAALLKQGVRFALTAAQDYDLSELLFIAGSAVHWGLSEEEALRSITLTPAELLGVSDRVGSIAAGRDADLVFLDGDPFAVHSVPQRVMIAGEFVYLRKESDLKTYEGTVADTGRRKKKDLVVIKCGRILTVTQGIIPDGVILVEGGKVSYVGHGRPVPTEARVVDASGCIVAPGMIDIQSHLGFHLDQDEQSLHAAHGTQSGNPSGNVVPASKLVRLDDPVFREAAASGVTSILLTPEGAGVCSIVKLSGEKTGVVREVGGYRFIVTGGTSRYEQMKRDLTNARKYHEEWEAYEKSLKEGQAATKPAETEGEKKSDPITGTWKGTMVIEQFQVKAELTIEMKLNGTQVSGTMTSDARGQTQTEAFEGTFQNGELRVEREEQGLKVLIVLKIVASNHLKGEVTMTGQGMTIKGTIEIKRVAGGEGQPSSSGTAATAKKEPRKDETLDPFRPLFRKEIPAIIETHDLPGVENAIRLFRDDFNLEYFIVGADQVLYAGDLLAAKGAGAAFGSDVVTDRRGAKLNVAEAVAASGVPVAFYSDATSGTKLLPLTASYAVRYGMDPFDALKALTIHPARMLRAEARLGSIERGRDADLVVLSGEPFELTSRVRMVFIDGKLVYEEK